MSSNESFGPSPAPLKRSRAEETAPFDPAGPEDTFGPEDSDPASPNSAYRAKKLRTSTLFSQAEYAVGELGSHCCRSAPTVTRPTDSELLTNGDSGFQELTIPTETSLDVNENNVISGTSTVPVVNSNLPAEPVNEVIEEKVEGPEFDDDDSISELSCMSDLSNLSGEDWKPISNHIKWVQMQMDKGTSPKDIIRQLTGEEVPDEVDDIAALRFIVRLLSESTVRSKLPNINTIDDVISLINSSAKIIVLTGAGVSVSCGIPDFRSRNGIYARLSKDYPDLPDPQSMFDIHYFKRNPHPFFKFAKEIYPGQFFPSPSHKFIRCIERKGKLLRNYSQNIDTLEQAAGIEKVIPCHGSFATASCTNCGFKVDSQAIKSDIFAQHIPLCTRCTPESTEEEPSIMPVMKPDIVFFGEGLSDEFHTSMTVDKDQCDLLIVIGSSLKVRPVALIPNSIPENIPQILINREPLNHLNFDVELLGDCDVIIKHLCERLGPEWTDFCFSNLNQQREQQTEEPSNKDKEFDYQFSSPSRYIFKGAELNQGCSGDDDDDEDDDDNSDSSENDTSENNLNTSEESVSQLSTSAESDDIPPLKDMNPFSYEETNVPDKLASLPPYPIPETIRPPPIDIKEKRESIENYSPNSY